jgi:hypothetical protein
MRLGNSTFTLFLTAVLAAPAGATVFAFPDIVLSGTNSLTAGNDSDGIGSLDATYDDETNELCMMMSWTLDADSIQATMAHFHGPASTTQTAGIRVGLTGLSSATADFHTEIFTLTEPHETELLAGLWYLNIHSDQWDAGELRGQTIAVPTTQSFSALPLDTDQAGVGPTGGAGTISTAYDDASNTLTFCLQWSGLSGPVDSAHFHEAPPGEPGDIVIGINSLPNFPSADTGTFVASVTVNEADEADLLAGLWYINLHTEDHPGGEIRGQLGVPLLVTNWRDY